MSLADPFTFVDLLDTLGNTPDEYIPICHRVGNGPWCTAIKRRDKALRCVATLPTNADVFFGVNPVRGPERDNAGRGGAADVTRLAALVVDLDAKPDGCGSIETCQAVVSDLEAVIGEYASAVVHSGGGLHAYWPIEDGQISDGFSTEQATALLRRWGRLVRSVAATRNANVDSVFDLARVLRVPGTVNHKRVTA